MIVLIIHENCNTNTIQNKKIGKLCILKLAVRFILRLGQLSLALFQIYKR